MIDTLAFYSTVFYKDFYSYTNSRLKELGMNFGSLFFLIYVGKHPGCALSELEKELQVDWGHLQRSINRLVEDGFMTKEKQGRSNRLNLTGLGLQVFETSHQVFAEWDEETLSVLDDGERAELFRLLQKAAQRKEGKYHV